MKFLENDRLSQLTAQLTEAKICERVINGRIEAFSMKRAGTDKKYAHALGEKYQTEILAEETEFSNLQQRFLQKESPPVQDTGLVAQNTSSTSPPSPRTKRVRIDVQPLAKRQRSHSTGGLPLPPIGKIPRASALRSRSDSYDLNAAHAINNFPYSNSPLGDFHDSSTQRLMTDLILTLNASFPDYDFSNIRPSHFARVPSSNVAVNRTNERLSELAACTAQGESFLPDLWAAIDDVIVLNESEVYSYVPPSRDDDDDPLSFLSDSLDGTDSAMPLWTFNFFFVNKNLKRILLFTCVQTIRTETDLGDAHDMDDHDDDDRDQDDEDSVAKEVSDFEVSPGRIIRAGRGSDVGVDGGGSIMDDEDAEGGGSLDYDMGDDGMNQAVAPPATVA